MATFSGTTSAEIFGLIAVGTDGAMGGEGSANSLSMGSGDSSVRGAL